MTAQDLVRRRKRLNLTQPQLAEALGTTTNTIWRWEDGMHPIPKWAEVSLKRLEAEKKVKA